MEVKDILLNAFEHARQDPDYTSVIEFIYDDNEALRARDLATEFQQLFTKVPIIMPVKQILIRIIVEDNTTFDVYVKNSLQPEYWFAKQHLNVKEYEAKL